MGRLTRKKTSSKKKKEPQLSKGSGETGADVAATQASQATASGKEAKKRQSAAPYKAAVPAKATAVKGQKNFLDKSLQFLREVKVELKKVTWPSRKQTIGSTVVVIVLVMIIAFFLGAVDIGLSSLVRVVLQ